MNGRPEIRFALAFDHELSLGGTKDYDRDLFAPTRRLLEAADRAGVKVVLFTDVLSAIVHERWGVDGFVTPYRQSLIDALRAGHDVQLHLHPHWLTSEYRDGTIVPSRDFALADFAEGTPSIEEIVAMGVNYLREIGAQAGIGYECVAFRAGGYNIVPETRRIVRALYDNGIRIDSSIIKGFRFRSGISEIDFSKAPSGANWFMPLDGPATAEAHEGMFEVPIASAPRTPLNNVPFLLKRVIYRNRRYSSGGRGIHDGVTGRGEKLKRLIPNSAWPLTFDNYSDSASDCLAILRRHVARHAYAGRIYCASVSHPKSMGDHALRVFREFTGGARSVFGDSLQFVTFQEIYANVAGRAAARI